MFRNPNNGSRYDQIQFELRQQYRRLQPYELCHTPVSDIQELVQLLLQRPKHKQTIRIELYTSQKNRILKYVAQKKINLNSFSNEASYFP